jgi:hypothetical protein
MLNGLPLCERVAYDVTTRKPTPKIELSRSLLVSRAKAVEVSYETDPVHGGKNSSACP